MQMDLFDCPIYERCLVHNEVKRALWGLELECESCYLEYLRESGAYPGESGD
jgi:hypothetical protein